MHAETLNILSPFRQKMKIIVQMNKMEKLDNSLALKKK